MAIDPVCGMEVDPGAAKYKTIYKGRVYYFCSHMCKVEFERRPEFYLEHGPQGMPTQEEHAHGHEGHHHGSHEGHSHHHGHGHHHGCHH